MPLGELPELVKRGRPTTGTENYGGPIVTAGGLVFIGATKDEKFRAFDKKHGQMLWETSLPAGGYATPSTYCRRREAVRRDCRRRREDGHEVRRLVRRVLAAVTQVPGFQGSGVPGFRGSRVPGFQVPRCTLKRMAAWN